MKKNCPDCGAEMVDARLFGYPRWIDMDHDTTRFTVKIPTGNVSGFKFLGMSIPSEETLEYDLKLRVCTGCGKVEAYVDFEEEDE